MKGSGKPELGSQVFGAGSAFLGWHGRTGWGAAKKHRQGCGTIEIFQEKEKGRKKELKRKIFN